MHPRITCYDVYSLQEGTEDMPALQFYYHFELQLYLG